jgi:tetratricopeptide (TPR) repeat protein
MLTSRALVLLVTVLGLVAATQTAAQPLQLPIDDRARKKLEAAQDYLAIRDWRAAVQVLQEILDREQAVFVETKPGHIVSARAEAERLLGTLPADGLDVYRRHYGPQAAGDLKEAAAANDLAKLAQVSRQFLYTEAGGEATERLGTALVDRGDLVAAARAFERLLQRSDPSRLEPLTLFKAARAFHRAGDEERKARAWKQLEAKSPKGLRLGDRDLGLKELARELEKPPEKPRDALTGWPMYRGDAGRSAPGDGGAPFLVRRFSQPMTSESQTRSWIFDGSGSAVHLLESRGQPVLPAFFPVAATITNPRTGKPQSIVVFRSYSGVNAGDLSMGKLLWFSRSDWSSDRMYNDSQKHPALSQWVQWYKDQTGKPNVLLENSTLGSFSTDNVRVYAIEDLAVPPFNQRPDPRFGDLPPPGSSPAYNQVVNDAIQHNKLQAIELHSGRTKWELGGKRPAKEPENKDPRDFRDSYFLGPPLCLGGKLYFLNEKSQEIRLVCFDPSKIPDRPTDEDKKGAILWVQPLGTAKEKILQEYGRRIHAAHIAHGEGILVCPTSAGTLLGVDVAGREVLWAHTYVAPQPPPPPPPAPPRRFPPGMPGPVRMDRWKTSAPAVVDGKVVAAPVDSDRLLCLRLRDGKLLWSKPWEQGDLYFAGVHAGRALVVGLKSVRTHALADGKELWRLDTGMPSGEGAAAGNVYYLPLKAAAATKEPEVCAIDVVKGAIVAHVRSRKGEVPGNLLFFEGHVISQNYQEVVGYPQLAVKLQKMDELLAKNPNDPQGLYERAQLRRDQGNLTGCVEDLRKARDGKPEPQLAGAIRQTLYEALTDLLRTDFNAAEKYIKEYEELLTPQTAPGASPELKQEQEAEARQRRVTYLMLAGTGYASQGRALKALDAYAEVAALKGPVDLWSVPGAEKLKVERRTWAAGRIAALLAAAPPAARQQLEAEIEKRWKEVRDGKDLDALRVVVALYGTFRIGHEARLRLAERLAEEGGPAFLEAELLLLRIASQKEDAQKTAQALETLARLLVRKGLLADAVHYYRILARDYPDTVIRDGKKGADLLQDLATDKRFLPYLQETPPVRHKIQATGESGDFPLQGQSMRYTFEHTGEPLPFFQQHRVALNYKTNHFKLIDRRTGKEKWSEPLKPNNFSYYLQFINNAGMPNQRGIRFDYRTAGHLVVLNLGQTVVALDPITHRVLWEKNLLGTQGLPPNTSPQIEPADGSLEVWFPDNFHLKVGQSGPVAASYVCLQSRDGLMALDALTGRTLWMRSDIPSRCQIFGDDKHVYLVETDENRAATATRAFRAEDGAAVSVPNFAPHYQKRVRVLGRVILAADDKAAAGLTLRLYDVQTGKDVWSKNYPAGSKVLSSEEPDLAGVVSPDGRASVVSLRTQKEVLVGAIDPKHLEKLQQAHLLADSNFIYVGFHTHDPAVNPWGQSVWPNLQPGTGLRGITINGGFYAFDRRTSKIKWVAEVLNQELILEQWKEMPILLFTARYNKLERPDDRFSRVIQLVGVESYEKISGKVTFYRPDLGQQIQNFYAVNYDAAAGKIELVGPNYRVIHRIEKR